MSAADAERAEKSREYGVVKFTPTRPGTSLCRDRTCVMEEG